MAASGGQRVTLPRLAFVATGVCFALVMILWKAGAFRGPEALWYDARFKLRGPLPAPDDVVVVAIDDRSLDLLGVDGPTPTRSQFAALVRALGVPPDEGGAPRARVIAFDYWLPEIQLPGPNAKPIFQQMLGLFPRETIVQGAALAAEDAALLVELNVLDAESLAALRDDRQHAALVRALDDRARRVGRRMREIEREMGFPDGLSPGYRRLLFPEAVHQLEADLTFAATIQAARCPVVLARFISTEGNRLPDPLFTAVAKQANINAVKDFDGVMRALPAVGQRLFEPPPGAGLAAGDIPVVPPLAIAALAEAEGEFDLAPVGPAAHLNRHPLASDGTIHVNFFGPAQTFRHVPLYRVVDELLDPERRAEDDRKAAAGELPARQPPLAPGELARAIVLVGDTTPAGQDFVATPFSRVERAVELGAGVHTEGGGELREMAGVEFHANVIGSVRGDAVLHPWGPAALVVACVVVALFGLVFYIPTLGFRWAIPLVLLLTALAAWGNHRLFAAHHRLVELFPPLTVLWLQFVAGVTTQGILQARKRAQVTQLFGRYLSPKVVRRMVDEEQALSMEGQARHITTLFSDIRGFTKLAESMTAREVGDVLQDYFERMIGVVFAHDGTLDKLMGDAVMAFWGAPEEMADHPVRTCAAALDMVRALEALHHDDPRPVMQQLDIGIGVNTGEVTVGNLGSHKFVNYTVLGDPVNLASRLEGQNKEYGTRIIVGEATVRAVPDGTFAWRELDWVKVKGKSQPVTVYELLGRPADVSEARRRALDTFARGLAAWRAGDFASADAAFGEALAADPDDGPSKAFRRRCAEYLAAPPAGEWDGVYVARSK